jgi:hypothetical protein
LKLLDDCTKKRLDEAIILCRLLRKDTSITRVLAQGSTRWEVDQRDIGVLAMIHEIVEVDVDALKSLCTLNQHLHETKGQLLGVATYRFALGDGRRNGLDADFCAETLPACELAFVRPVMSCKVSSVEPAAAYDLVFVRPRPALVDGKAFEFVG